MPEIIPPAPRPRVFCGIDLDEPLVRDIDDDDIDYKNNEISALRGK
jgi:hypothetical protein